MADDRQLYILCDTNAAVRDAHLFRKKGGPLLVAMLRAKKAKLLVPEVLRMEYINQFTQAGDDALQKATKELDKLKTLCGYDMSGFPFGTEIAMRRFSFPSDPPSEEGPPGEVRSRCPTPAAFAG